MIKNRTRNPERRTKGNYYDLSKKKNSKPKTMIHYLDSHNNPLLVILVWLGSILLYITGDNVFRCISIISVLMIIVINSKPFINVVKSWFKKDENKRKRK